MINMLLLADKNSRERTIKFGNEINLIVRSFFIHNLPYVKKQEKMPIEKRAKLVYNDYDKG